MNGQRRYSIYVQDMIYTGLAKKFHSDFSITSYEKPEWNFLERKPDVSKQTPDRVFFSHYLLQCRWILRQLRSLCLVRSVRQRKYHHTVWYIYIYIYIYTIYTHLNIELKALEFVEIEDRMVVSRVWGNWEDVGQRVQTWLKNKIKTQAYQLEKDADSEGDCVYVKYRV